MSFPSRRGGRKPCEGTNMKLLSRAEEIILITVLKLSGNAYGITIREEIRKATGNQWSFASIYDPLNKLTRKGYVLKGVGSPTPERGGRSKCLYEITKEGKAALREIKEVQNNIWDGIAQMALK